MLSVHKKQFHLQLQLCIFLVLMCFYPFHRLSAAPLRVSDKPVQLPDYAEQQEDRFILPELEEKPLLGQGSGATFLLKSVQFNGNTVFSDSQLNALCTDYLNQEINIGDLETLRFQLTQFYVKAGYLNSGVLLPDQKISSGIVLFNIIEGKLSAINIHGNGDLKTHYISERLNISKEDIFNKNQLQKSFQKLLADPLISRLNGRLKPLNKTGEALLDLEVTRAKPYQFTFSLSNHHPVSSGEIEAQIHSTIRNLTGYGDKLQLNLDLAEADQYYYGLFSMPINANNTSLFTEISYDDAHIIEESLKNADIESSFQSFGFGISHPLIDDIRQQFSIDLLLSWRHSETFLLGEGTPFSEGVEADGESTTSVIRFSQNYTQRSQQFVLATRSTFNIGVNALDATINSHKIPDSQFVSWIGQLQYAHKFSQFSGQLIGKTNLQLANERLLPLEQIAIGGPDSVRGYRDNQFIRDNGWDASIEYRYPLLGNPFNPKMTSLQVAAFVDAGTAWNKNESFNSHNLSSAGLGFIWKKDNLYAELYWAHPFKEMPEQAGHYIQDEGISFRLTGDF
ncbi:MAG: BamA/TamA family outer membrane protein [gamma proteobacterium symbiont of Taylorina sp.]|nr:BamA/TamA family outer membrane protein [gamma proteobacterium symbiont of Taylorina sp.]